jgi:hypothetical protein
VDVTEKDETEFSFSGKKQFRERRDDVYDEKNENSGAVRSTTTRVRLAYRSPLKVAGLHPVIRALEMGRHRHLVNDRAAVEVRRVRSPVSDGGTNKKGRTNEGEQEKTRRQNVSDVLDARLAAEARPSLLRMTTRWRKARTFDTIELFRRVKVSHHLRRDARGHRHARAARLARVSRKRRRSRRTSSRVTRREGETKKITPVETPRTFAMTMTARHSFVLGAVPSA